MPTQSETIEFILGKLRDRGRFSARAMFGEYALYADGKVVASAPLETAPTDISVEGDRVHVEAYSNVYDFELRP